MEIDKIKEYIESEISKIDIDEINAEFNINDRFGDNIDDAYFGGVDDGEGRGKLIILLKIKKMIDAIK